MYNVIHYTTNPSTNELPAIVDNQHVIQSFAHPGTEDLFNRVNSNAARRLCPQQLWPVAQRKLDQLNAVISLASLRIPPGDNLEALLGDRQGQHSIRVNSQYQICFTWTEDGPDQVELTDYH